MQVRFSRVNEDDNSFDQILVVDGVSLDGFEAARKFEAGKTVARALIGRREAA